MYYGIGRKMVALFLFLSWGRTLSVEHPAVRHAGKSTESSIPVCEPLAHSLAGVPLQEDCD